MAKANQTEMVGVGKRDAVGKAALAFLAAREAVEKAKEDVETSAQKLIDMMQTAGRTEIKLEGVTITLRQMEAQDVLKVKKPKQSASK